MSQRFSRINKIFAALLAGTLGLVPVLALLSSLWSYDGNCYGFMDGATPCAWQAYAADQMFFALLLALVPLAGLGGLWGGYAAGALVSRAMADRLDQPQRLAAGAVAALLGCASGGLATGAAVTLLMVLIGGLGRA